MKRIMRGVGIFLLLTLIIIPASVFAQDDDTSDDSTFTIAGSRLVTEALRSFITASEVEFDAEFSPNGTGNGFADFCNGNTAITGATRPISVQEETFCNTAGVEYAEYRVGFNAIAVITHPDLTFAECLTPGDLTTIFAPSAQNQVVDWAQVGLETLESTPLTAAIPAQNTAAFALLDAQVDGFGLRTDVENVADNDEIIEFVASTSGAIGIVPFSELNDANVQLVQIQNEDLSLCITPEIETIETGEYVLTNELLVYVNLATMGQAGLQEVLSVVIDADAASVLTDVGITPPSQDTYDTNQAILAGEVEPGRQFSRDLVAFEIPASVNGTLTIGGAASLANYANSTTSAFNADYPGVTFQVNVEGQLAGIRRFCSGELDVMVINRDLTAEEQTLCENNTITPITLDLGGQAIVLLGHDDDAYPSCLTPEQVLTIWRTNANAPETWVDVDESFPDEALTLLAPTLGRFDYTDILLSTGSGPAQPIRLDVAENRDDPLYRTAAVAQVPGGLTYMSWTDYQDVLEAEQDSGVRLIDINADGDCISPTEGTIASLSYPYSIAGKLIISQSALARTEVQSFVWYLFQDNNYFLYNNAGLVGITFGDLTDIRDGLQETFEVATTAGLEAAPTVNTSGTTNFGPPLPFEVFSPNAPEEADEEEVEAEVTPEATEEAE